MLLRLVLVAHGDKETGDEHELDRRDHHKYKGVDQLVNKSTVVGLLADWTFSAFQHHGAFLL